MRPDSGTALAGTDLAQGRGSMAMSRSPSRRGFTLIELSIVVLIVAIMAALALSALNNVIRRGTLASAHHTIGQAFEQAKAYTYSHADDVIFVIVGNDTPVNAALCGSKTFQPMKDSRCVRYFLLQDLISTGAPVSVKFDANELAAFDPLNPESRGDKLLGSGYLGAGVMIGTAPGYTPVAPVVNSIFEGFTLVPANLPCSFCAANVPPQRGFIRFGADGQVKMGNEAAFLKSRIGGFIAFTGFAPGGSQIATTNWVAISVPAGLVTERFSQSGK